MFNRNSLETRLFSQAALAVLVSSLGYFVDIYDLFIFSVVRIKSLKSLGVSPEQSMDAGIFLLDAQMLGLILGGVVWGVLGDRIGRKKVLFGSIFLYSLANLFNAGVTSLPAYAVLRFIAGFGLAGELGAAVTLVSEALSRENRGWGTTLIATFGLLGGVVAGWVGEWLPWRQAFALGGVMGLCLLCLRVGLKESKLFQEGQGHQGRGRIRFLLWPPKRALSYLSCIWVGIPVYFTSGILIFFAPEFAKVLGIQGEVNTGQAILTSYLGAVIGDLAGGAVSQIFRNRKKVLGICLCLNFAMVMVFLQSKGYSSYSFYWICGIMGVTTGYWTVLMTLSAEQFGTNIRATVATTVPNFVRGSVLVMASVFKALKGPLGLLESAGVVAVGVILLAVFGLWRLEETFGKDLDFFET